MYKLLNKVLEAQQIPTEWKKGLLVKLPKKKKKKKGDLSICSNWRDITLLTVASKIVRRIILKSAADKVLRDEQAGFRSNRSCSIDQIATLRIIIELSVEWQSSLYISFIDFEKALDSVNRECIYSAPRLEGKLKKRKIWQKLVGTNPILVRRICGPFNVVFRTHSVAYHKAVKNRCQILTGSQILIWYARFQHNN